MIPYLGRGWTESSLLVIILNTSGSGKTKLLFEGLCQHWGFYFTFAMDGSRLGPHDLAHIPRSIHMNWKLKWTQSLPPFITFSAEHYWPACLSFKLFLEACIKEGFCHHYRQRWLEAQLFPDELANLKDPFKMLQIDVHKARVDGSVIDEAMAQMLEEIQEIWGYAIGRSATGEWDDWRWSSDTDSFDNPESQRRHVSQFLPPEFQASEDGQVLMLANVELASRTTPLYSSMIFTHTLGTNILRSPRSSSFKCLEWVRRCVSCPCRTFGWALGEAARLKEDDDLTLDTITGSSAVSLVVVDDDEEGEWDVTCTGEGEED
ncbi:hypothetical protein D9757_014724 [Collybiopsis confluens]|uniref:Uncharacterized protein n=1 Tax=Collybiopsis confluens TaxID=2823264 RepID=A0A8H5D825_9AGAR|nr:hypothetical protein D9757_014724 [Collybiopsis confluens]